MLHIGRRINSLCLDIEVTASLHSSCARHCILQDSFNRTIDKMYRVILSVLSGFSLLLPTLANEAAAAVDTNCTTLEPIFIPQFLGTVTKYKSTTVVTTKVDCSGCVLSSRTYSGAVLPPVRPTSRAPFHSYPSLLIHCQSGSPTTVTSPLLTSISAVCRRSPPVTTTTSLPPITLPKAVVTGTNAPPPSIAPSRSSLSKT